MSQDAIDKLVSLIFSTKRLLIEQGMRKCKVDPAMIMRMETLKFISEQNGPTMKDIADLWCITPPSATSLVNNLVKSGQIRRVADVHDRRLVRLVITPFGKKNYSLGEKKIQNTIRKVLSVLDEKDIKQYISILEKILKHIKNL